MIKTGRGHYRHRVCLGDIAVACAAESTWWDWPRGSAPFFWNWPEEFQDLVRDGLPPRFTGQPPVFRKLQRPNKDPTSHGHERSKLRKVRDRGYIAATRDPILSLMSFFSVPKVTVYNEETGEDEVLDIRMVYNGSSCGLNQVLWAPWFGLPTSEQMLRTVDVGYWGGDNDYGEMFLNWWLHKSLRPYCGVDLTVHFPEEQSTGTKNKVIWEVWTRPAMGLRPSPYQSIQGCLIVKREALGDPKDPNNVFRWDRVELNLPGQLDYKSGDPWVSKRRVDDQIAADRYTFLCGR